MSIFNGPTGASVGIVSSSIGNQGFTMMCWYKVASAADYQIIMDWSLTNADWLEMDSSGLVQLWCGGQDINAATVSFGVWNHFAITVQSGSFPSVKKCYINGVFKCAGSSSAGPTACMTWGWAVFETANGSYANGKAWLTELTPAEIQTEMNWTYAIKTANLFGVYPFHSTSGSSHLQEISGTGAGNLTQSGSMRTTATEPPIYAEIYKPVFWPITGSALPNVLQGQLWPR